MSQPYLILVVDDEAVVREMLEDNLTGAGYRVATASNGMEALEQVSRLSPDFILMDNRMPGQSGIEVLETLSRAGLKMPVILMTAYGSTKITINAMKLGAFDYLVKPFKIKNLLKVIDKALQMQSQDEGADQPEQEPNWLEDQGGLIGQSLVMQEVYKTIGIVASTDVTVLIQGESGTGKELIARAIQKNSNRQNQPFVKVNCASIPENLLEAELFGHEKGAFTGAENRRLGKFEIAHRGTIFLDEIGEMSLATQVKLLRVLQDKEFERIGGNAIIKCDVRIIAASNKDLKLAAVEGSFREDLFFRLNVVTIWMPPLRDRMSDLPELINYFLNKYRGRFNKNMYGLSKKAKQILEAYTWPGNVRELQNTFERAVVMCKGHVIQPEDLPLGIKSLPRREESEIVPKHGLPLKETMQDLERQVIINALEDNKWNRTAAAQQLCISRRSLYDKMRQFGLEK